MASMVCTEPALFQGEAVELTHLRQLDILRPTALSDREITLIGAGGTGTHVGHMLARMGLPFHVWDGDSIELHNLANQLGYNPIDMNENKALTLAYSVNGLVKVEAVQHMWEGFDHEDLPAFTDIMISGVDSILARKRIWRKLRGNRRVKLYVDCRMGGEVFQFYAFDPSNPKHIENYEQILELPVDPDPCTGSAIAYNLFGQAAKVGKLLQLYLTGRRFPNEGFENLRGMEWGVSLSAYGYWED